MPLLPYDTLLIDSPLPADGALARLQAATGPRRWTLWRGLGPAPRPFTGTATADEIRIERVIGYGNAFRPRIRGRIEPRAGGSRLTATMSLHPFVSVFMLVWFGGVLATGLRIVAAPPSAGIREPVLIVIPPAMLLLGWLLVAGGFTFEAWRARSRLTELLDARTPADGRRPRAA